MVSAKKLIWVSYSFGLNPELPVQAGINENLSSIFQLIKFTIVDTMIDRINVKLNIKMLQEGRNGIITRYRRIG